MIVKDPEDKTSKSGNKYTSLVVVVDPSGTKDGGGSVFWNMTIMGDLRAKLPNELFAKFRYARFIGLGTQHEYNGKMYNDMLVNGVELQDGTYVSSKKEESEEDAPF